MIAHIAGTGLSETAFLMFFFAAFAFLAALAFAWYARRYPHARQLFDASNEAAPDETRCLPAGAASLEAVGE